MIILYKLHCNITSAGSENNDKSVRNVSSKIDLYCMAIKCSLFNRFQWLFCNRRE